MAVPEEIETAPLVLDKNDIWRASHAEKMSYPEEGNNYCFAVEDNSFWFKHRNDVILTLTQRFEFAKNFADVGGGNGFQVKFLSEKYPEKQIFLIEPGYAGCLNAKKRGVKDAYNIFFQEFPFVEKQIDAVGLFDVIEHIEDDKAFLTGLAQYLPSGSHIYITVPAHQWLWSEVDDESGHYRRYNLEMFDKLAKDCGLEYTYGSDEVIVPSYTFVSTANAFVLRGAKIVFADSSAENPNLDADKLSALITPKTKAIVVVHYAGIACDMDKIMAIAEANNLYVIEDAAQAVDSFYEGRPLGSIGHLSAFSFHETKNIISGEGGMLVINDERFEKRAEIIWEKGTNRSAFWRGEVDKYNWVDIGSSFLPSEVVAAYLFAQLENLEKIQSRRKQIWEKYYEAFSILEQS
eukprot:gene25409-30682_t